MKCKVLVLLLWISLLASGQEKKENTFFSQNDFSTGFGKEMGIAEMVYKNMVKNGLKDNALIAMDFTFISDEKEKLDKLATFIQAHYPYEIDEVKPYGDIWEINGKTNPIPITQDNLIFWGLDMHKRGYEFDASFEAYGGFSDAGDQHFPNLDKTMGTVYFNAGLVSYNEGDLSGAIINWSLTITINPNDPDAYYSRAIAKEGLYVWKAALADYDKALQMAPDFISALLNRGALKDDHGDYKGAVEDYDKALQTGKVNKHDEQLIYFNRGNSKFNLKDLPGACEDWKKAVVAGSESAKEKLNKYCK